MLRKKRIMEQVKESPPINFLGSLKKKRSRLRKQNPRALGTNPRAKGTNPNAIRYQGICNG
jgi:hypothetical protein